ncbi:MAG: hypothetical protein WCS77_03370 [Elusimicrobiaceae bacterium]|jgi:hypothetical protein
MRRKALFAVAIAVTILACYGIAKHWPAGKTAQMTAVSDGTAQPADEAGEVARKLAVLDEIFLSKNDNDPRLDTEFNNISPELGNALRSKYRALPRESLNERGTIVFLLRKNMSREDWAFLKQVAAEPPCLSLADCAKGEKLTGGHRELGLEISLSYPAMVALKQAELALTEEQSAQAALEVIRAGKTSKAPVVADTAARLEAKFPPAR